MNSLPIVALIGMAVLVTATVGFGNTLATSPDFNFIAASDNNAVTAARGNVTELVWTEEVGLHGEIETDLITFTVGNEDGISGHAFNICAVIQFDNVTGTFFSPLRSCVLIVILASSLYSLILRSVLRLLRLGIPNVPMKSVIGVAKLPCTMTLLPPSSIPSIDVFSSVPVIFTASMHPSPCVCSTKSNK